jgi:ParB-like chromosome segregation protein Spo0J
MTEINDKYRRQQIHKLLEDYTERKATKSETLTYRGKERTFPVITIDPSVLLLNHNNNRLAAQLFDHPNKGLVYGDPTSEQAQSIIADLLKQTDKFKNLQNQLDDYGQIKPGLITRNGLLVNGNTRTVALRLLNKAGVDVAVLPDDVDDAAILDLEMDLQMVQLVHQDYTFTNELLLLEKCKTLNYSEKLIAGKMKWSRGWQKKLEERFQLLRLINEIREVMQPVNLAYEIFDQKSQHLRDLNQEYESLKVSDLEAANRMKWSRVAAMFLDVNKDQTRAIDEDFVDEDVSKRSEPGSLTTALLSKLKKINVDDGLSKILGEPEDCTERVDAKELAKEVIKARVDKEGFITGELTPSLEDLRRKMIFSAEAIITKQKRSTLLATPAQELQEIREDLERVVSVFNEVCLQQGFNAGQFEYELKKAFKSLEDLRNKFGKFKERK